MRACAFLACCLIATGAFAQSKSNPGSLFDQGSFTSPFEDRTARRVGDVVTILISESSVSSFNAQTQATKGDSNNVTSELVGNLLGSFFSPLSNAASSSVSGDGQTSQTGRMTARMSAIVTDVLPNGNMVVEGRRTLITNKQTQTIRLSGVVRKDDVSPLNVVRSEDIAMAEIRMEGEGLIMNRQRTGILTRLLDWLF